jgi:hypothetical protein
MGRKFNVSPSHRTRVAQNPSRILDYAILLHSSDVCRIIREAGLLGPARMRV